MGRKRHTSEQIIYCTAGWSSKSDDALPLLQDVRHLGPRLSTRGNLVPGVEGSRCEREPRLASCSVRAKLVARGRAPRPAHGLARGVLRRAGCAPAHAVLTSTHRTARCGPACLVVWEGKDRDRRSSPIPIAYSVPECAGRPVFRELNQTTRSR